MDIIQSHFDYGGSTGVYIDLTFGIEGYDALFWGADEDERQTYWDTSYFGGPRFDIRFEVNSIES